MFSGGGYGARTGKRATSAVLICRLRTLTPLAPRRRRLDAEPPLREAYQRARKRLLQTNAGSSGGALSDACRQRAIEPREQRLDLAEFGRSLVPEAVDRTCQETKPDLLRHCGKRGCVKILRMSFRGGTPLERKIALGAVGE